MSEPCRLTAPSLWKEPLMPTRRMDMRQVRELMRLHREAGLGVRETARRAGIAVSTMREMVKRFDRRSEEHTSELQSLMRSSYDVFCLNKTHTVHTNTPA